MKTTQYSELIIGSVKYIIVEGKLILAYNVLTGEVTFEPKNGVTLKVPNLKEYFSENSRSKYLIDVDNNKEYYIFNYNTGQVVASSKNRSDLEKILRETFAIKKRPLIRV